MKVALVLQGGSMKGLYSAGVMDVMMEHNIHVDGIIGVSVGSLFGPNYFSKQKGRALRYNQRFCKDLRFISMPSFIFTGNIVNKQFAYYDMTFKHDVFDNETFIKNNTGFWATATNIETGKAEYLEMKDVYDGLEKLRASAAIPFFCKIVEIDDKKYLDGGVGDNVPVRKCKALGYNKIVVILTQTRDERKEPLSHFMMNVLKLKYHRYPLFLEALRNRHEMCNQTIDEIIEMEKNEEIFVFAPSRVLNIGTIERDVNHMQEIYDLGRNEALQQMPKLIEYLKK